MDIGRPPDLPDTDWGLLLCNTGTRFKSLVPSRRGKEGNLLPKGK